MRKAPENDKPSMKALDEDNVNDIAKSKYQLPVFNPISEKSDSGYNTPIPKKSIDFFGSPINVSKTTSPLNNIIITNDNLIG